MAAFAKRIAGEVFEFPARPEHDDFAFARWGGAFTPLLVVTLLNYVSWRTAFAVFACLGVVWAVAFFWWFRDDPHDNPHVNAAERALIASSRKLAGLWQRFSARRLPCFAAVIGALDDLPEPATRLRCVDPVWIYRRSLKVIEFPAREMRTADIPLFALSVCF